MSTTAHVRRARLRYHLVASAADERRRLDRLARDELPRWLDGPLTAALADAGVGPGEEVLIRQVDVPVTIRLGSGDAAVAARWAAALADAIRRALTDRTRADVVRYRTRAAALADVVASVADRDLTRSWAWSRLGLWPAGPRSIAATADDRTVAAALVHALVAEPRSAPAALAIAIERRPFRADALAGLVPVAAWTAVASAVVGGYGCSPTSLLASRPPSARPAAVARSPLLLLADAVVGRAAPAERPDVAAAAAVLVLADRDPAVLLRPTVDDDIAAVASSILARPAAPPATDDAVVAAATAESPPQPGTPTEWAGLLYLLHLVGPSDLDEQPVRPLLHQTALALLPIEPDDPAALAFAGLPADAPLPDPVPGGDELAAAIAGRLRRLRLRDRPAIDEVAWVCRRPGRIVADPGWIEVELPLDAVDLDIRRAGLDIDPGWIPWLGTVVRFVYA